MKKSKLIVLIMVVFSLSLGGCSFFNGLFSKKQEMIHSREKILKLYSLDYAYREIIQQVNLDVPCKSKDYEKYLYFLNVKVTMKDRLKQLLKNLLKLKKLR